MDGSNQGDVEDWQDNGIPIELRVDQVIRQLLDGGHCSASMVADALDMKLRTLQYQLQQHGTNYQALYDAVRLDLAKAYLRTSAIPVGTVAARLVFTDSASFSNFFKSRTGVCPREYAKRVRQP